jgi:hypothetical protein
MREEIWAFTLALMDWVEKSRAFRLSSIDRVWCVGAPGRVSRMTEESSG